MAIGSTPPVSNRKVPGYVERLTYLESLEAPSDQRGRHLASRAWGGVWPVVLAIVIVLALWQLIHLSGWKKAIFPGPGATLSNLWHQLGTGLLWHAIATTAERAIIGFGLAVLIGAVVGAAGVPHQATAGGGRVADHRAADAAVDRLVPVRDHLVRDLHRRPSCSSSSSAPPRRSPTA